MKDTKNGLQKTTDKSPRGSDAGKYVYLVLLGLASAFILRRGYEPEHLLGGFLIAALLIFIVFKDLMRYKPQYLENVNMLVLLAMMLVLVLGSARLWMYAFEGMSRGLDFEAGGASVFGLPIPAGAMLITLLFDFHTALIFSVVVSLLGGLWLQDPAMSIYAFVGSIMAAFSVIRCRKRTDILKGGLYVFGANALSVVTILLFGGELLTIKAPFSLLAAGVSAISVVAMVSILLPLMEYIFKATTDISLLELLDLEHPLMKSLMISAPGTYHHSIVVGNLVEGAAEAVSVNPLLARACAYYHDIGKVKMPEYFIENQSTGRSKHEDITPHMSSIILMSHVKEGLELARQNKLPKSVTDIIEQHHGTSLITYFYEKAKEHEEPGTLSEEEYRYPGPKPQSRVAALLMVADAVDAASRVLNEPNPAKISALVDKIINHIFLEGQLDECELTLKDIQEIKTRFKFILTGILHRRVDYPGFDFNGTEKPKKDGGGEGPGGDGRADEQPKKSKTRQK